MAMAAALMATPWPSSLRHSSTTTATLSGPRHAIMEQQHGSRAISVRCGAASWDLSSCRGSPSSESAASASGLLSSGRDGGASCGISSSVAAATLIRLTSRGPPSRPGTSFGRKNLISRMAKGDDPQAQLAKDLQNIEEFLPDFDELDKDELQQFLDMELESSVDYETFRHYEIMYLIHEKNADEVQDVIRKVQDFITDKKGKIYRLNDWGMRSLAYDIKKAKRANYVLMNIEVDSQAVNALNALLEKDERVIRHMVMSQKAAISEDSVPPEEYRPSRDAEDEDEEWDDEEGEEEGEEEEEEDDESELALQRE